MRDIVNKIKDYVESNDALRNIRDNYGNQIKKILIVAVLIVVCLAFFAFRDGGDEEASGEVVVASEEDAEIDMESQEPVYVDIDGAVKNPMLAELPGGSRIEDAIEAAGGVTEDADMTGINRAAFAEDGSKIYIPFVSEDGASQASSDGGISMGTSTGGVSTGASASSGKININSADSTALQQLNGVGPATAQKIIDYRTANGRFKSIEELKNVSGIGDKTYEKLKEFITI